MKDIPVAAAWRRRVVTLGMQAGKLFRKGGGLAMVGEARGRWILLSYAVHCDAGFVPRDATARIAREKQREASQVTVRDGVRRLDGVEQAAVAGPVDLDLAFTAATNLIPLRRLTFPPGHKVAASAAWLARPEKHLAPLVQFHTRLPDDTLGCRAPAASHVDPSGFVTDYPGPWHA